MVEAMTSVYDVIDQDDEVIDAGAFDNDESRRRVADRMVKLMDTHGWSSIKNVLGVVEFAEDRDVGGKRVLFTRSRFGRDSESDLAREKVLDGLITHQSVAFYSTAHYFQGDEGKAVPMPMMSPVADRRHVKQAVLWEASLVPFPSNLGARITRAKDSSREYDDSEDGKAAGRIVVPVTIDVRAIEKQIREATGVDEEAGERLRSTTDAIDPSDVAILDARLWAARRAIG